MSELRANSERDGEAIRARARMAAIREYHLPDIEGMADDK